MSIQVERAHGLEALGLVRTGRVHWNLGTAALYEEALRRDPNVGFNSSWETRRVWLESYEENNKKVRIKGVAKSHDDAAEFMKRLNSSVFFRDVRLDSTVRSTVPTPGSVPSAAS